MAQFKRKKSIVESHIKKLNNRPASQDTNTSRHTSSSTGDPGHTRRHPQHPSTLPKRLPGSWWTICGIAHGRQADASPRVPKRRKFSSLLRTRSSQQAIFEIRRLFSRSLETDELWPTHKRNAPRVLHPRQRHRCGRFNRSHPWPAAKPVCSPPTTAVVVRPFGVFEYFEQSAQ